MWYIQTMRLLALAPCRPPRRGRWRLLAAAASARLLVPLLGPVVLVVAVVAPPPAAAQNVQVDRPFVTDTAQVLPSSMAQLGLGAEFVRLPARESLTSAPVLSLRVGLATIAELSANYRWLWRRDPDGPDSSGTGDLFLFTKIRLLDGRTGDGRRGVWPAAAIRLGVKLPNASARDRLGTNNTDFSMLGLLTERLGPVELRLSGGLQILESPFDPLAQTDAATLSAALLLHAPGGVVPFVEYYRQWANKRAFDFAEGRAGLRWNRGRLALDLFASAGFSGDRSLGFAGELSRDWGVGAGASWRFDIPGFGRVWGR